MNILKQKLILVALLLGVFFEVCAQSNKGLKLDLSGTPLLSNLAASDNYSSSFNLGVYYPIFQSLTCGLQFRETYDFYESTKDYDALSSIGVGVGYAFFEGKQDSFWDGATFEVLTDIGGGFSNLIDDKSFLYADLSCRVYIRKLAYVSIGYNYKLYEEKIDDTNGIYVSTGFKF